MDLTRRDALRVGGLTLAGTLATGTASAAVTTRDLRIASWDDTELAATLFLPPGSDEHPAVLMTHGWGLDRSTAEARAQTYAENGYVVLTYDSRGFGESEGQVGVDGPNEVNDAQALITWLANQPHVRADGDDPVVGMDGESYAGGIQLNTAAVDDRLDAIVPRWSWHDLRYSLEPNGRPLDGAKSYEDGVVKAGWAAALFGLGTAGSRGVTAGGNNHPDTYDTEGLSPRIHESLAKGLATNDIPDDEEAWFRVRSPSHKLDDIDIPTLLISGWVDTLFTPKEAVANFRGLRETGTDARLLLFNGGHVAGPGLIPGNAHTDAAALAWLDTHLKGDGQSDRPVVEVFDEQTGTYRLADAIEPVGTDDPWLSVADVLGSGSTPVLNSVAPTSTSHFSPVDHDATEATAMRIDVPIERETTVFGAPEVDLTATLLGTEARLFLKAYHVTDDGETLIDGQVTPTRLTGTLGTTVSETIAMEPFYRTFTAGDTLRFVVATSDAGHVASRETAGVEVHHDDTTIRYPTRRALGAPGNGDGHSDDGADGEGTPNVSASRNDDGSVFTGGQTNHVELTVTADEPVFVRDRTPAGWTVDGGDPHDRTAPPETDGNYVVFDRAVTDATLEYFAAAPSGAAETGPATFGPVEVSTDGETWTAVGTEDRNVVVGQSL